MQGAKNIELNEHNISSLEELERISLELWSEKNEVLVIKEKLDETLEEFNDMSYMQAIDLLSAIEAVKITLKENNIKFNSQRIIGYGHSHGAYLLHLSNILAPHLFSFIIDNSSWIEPVYLSSNRYLFMKFGNASAAIEFDYIAKEIIKSKHLLNLNALYSHYSGTTRIISFQGNNDNLVNHLEKKQVIEKIRNSKFVLVTEEDTDHEKYFSNTHGLDANFLKLFSYALEFEHAPRNNQDFRYKYSIDLKGVSINVDYTNGLPVFNFLFDRL